MWAGPSLAARLSSEGLKVAVVEKNKFGGTCVNNGCTPTKAMVASAYAAFMARRAAAYGVVVDGIPGVNMERTPPRVCTAAPAHGEHTDQVLCELGYAEDEIARLHQAGIA